MLSDVISNSKIEYAFESEYFLKELVSIDSQVKNLKGIESVQIKLERELKSLGLKTEFIENTLSPSAPLLMASKNVNSSRPTVTFIGHSDVITPVKINPFKIDTANDLIYGSGIADDKGGVVVCIKALSSCN